MQLLHFKNTVCLTSISYSTYSSLGAFLAANFMLPENVEHNILPKHCLIISMTLLISVIIKSVYSIGLRIWFLRRTSIN